MSTSLHAAATELHRHGINVIPVHADGTKRPAISAWPDATPTLDDLDHWFGTTDSAGRPRHTALGIVAGTRSGNIELLEIEGDYAELAPDLANSAAETGLADVWARVSAGWLQQSPSGGLHWIYRVRGQEVPGNTKLAQDEAHFVNGRRTYPTIAETRGTGGYFVAAPTGGDAHDTGRPWVTITGGPDTMATIDAEEREALHALFGIMDMRRTEATSSTAGGSGLTGILAAADGHTTAPAANPADGSTPGDHFEKQTSWQDLLGPAGWTHVFTRGTTSYWRRPGKSIGFSATTGHAEDRDRLFVFTTSTEFPTEEPITKFGAYAVLHHGGDHSAAAAQLRKDGYGEPARPQLTPPETPTTAAPTTPGAPAAPPGSAATGTDGKVVDLAEHQAKRDTEDQPDLEPVAGYGLALTDDSNANALMDRHGQGIRYHTDRSKWMVWNGHQWESQPTHGGRARELAKDTARRLPERVGNEDKDKVLRHKRYSLSDRGLSAMLNTTRTDPKISVATDDLDQHAWELNTPGGIVNLRTGTIGPCDPERLHTRSATCAPDPDADQGPWLTFLAQTFPEQEVRDYIQRLVGYSAVGEVREHILPFAHGGGGNGKGVFLETIKHALGTYAGKAPANFLMSTPYPEHTTSIADLAGRRFVITSEVNQKDKFDEQKVKELTGGDTVTARHMHQDFFEFEPTHHLWLMGNDKPAVESGGEAFWRRLRLIPFTHTVPAEEVDEELPIRLRTEHTPAILQWIIDGAVRYAAEGLGQEPAAVQQETEKYAASADTVGQFLAEECFTGESYTDQATRVSDFRAAYERWCQENGEHALGGRRLTTHLARHGIQTGRDAPKGAGGARLYGGVLLRSTEGQQDTLDRFKD
ncbi:bifunctional DNA primase/polymerase [Nesterenkonia sp. E16_7]|uniref:phage/plasmid primase, P4 family n=1 Tax=unclassified Nesterenkonia TaxID=2629769 RepID=UPI001A922262|nr:MULTISPECIES: phage/plasmid primase, P4 family [unclassified Nesterenkonia]MBO0596362.1 bifunctional DNA primase/polymerase [Nesterenkonia sp. E16_10]MBO0597410.1 bifunctional DNA primase/polymerase [Nesterenkonia sp. E16_7]